MGAIFLLILWICWVVKSGTTALWWTGGIILLILGILMVLAAVSMPVHSVLYSIRQ